LKIKNSNFRPGKKLISAGIKTIKTVPFVKNKIEKEYGTIISELKKIAKPYNQTHPPLTSIPDEGWEKDRIIKIMEAMNIKEGSRWKKGFASGAVYSGDEEHITFLNKVYGLNSQSNPLHSDLWPSVIKYEAEIVAMTAEMLNAKEVKKQESIFEGEVCGNVTSGGTESILLAMKTYRDWGKEKQHIKNPEIVMPVTAHAAFEKAAQYFNIRIKKIQVDNSYRADIEKVKKAITKNTVVLVGSSPNFPHGIIDPIEELSEIARERGIGFHVDACLGGFILPWAEKLGYKIPPFDFRLQGVTSISCDTHKYGYAAKGSSVILYRGEELRHFQYFKTTDWPGGLYFSPTISGSRPGALIAECWAAMVSMGKNGYMEATEKILSTASTFKQGIKNIPEIFILGDPLWVIAFTSKTLDIYRIMDYMAERNWSLNGLHFPRAVHICITLRHTLPGVAERFIEDLESAVKHVKENPGEKGRMAPIYGMASSFPDRSMVSELMERYMDILYKP